MCREMGWTYEEYENQPNWFLVELAHQLNSEAKQSQRLTHNE